MAKLIFGCGYLGRRVARQWLQAGHEVYAATRSLARAKEFAEQGLRPIVADLGKPDSLAELPCCETVLFAVGFDRASGQSIEEVYVGGLARALAALSSGCGRIIYISSTGVYSQDNGGWVNEDSPAEPRRAGGRACLAAEKLLAGHPLGGRAVVLRLAGLYGPGRIPRRDDVAAGRPLAAPSEGYLNLIHVDDAAATVLAAEQCQTLPRLFVVSDGRPVVRGEYFAELARLLSAPAPRFAPAAADSPAAERAGSDKRIDPARAMAELGVRLRYPSYREGLAAIVGEESRENK
jgi:nucleoside-diphosphate-sugar epimerase